MLCKRESYILNTAAIEETLKFSDYLSEKDPHFQTEHLKVDLFGRTGLGMTMRISHLDRVMRENGFSIVDEGSQTVLALKY